MAKQAIVSTIPYLRVAWKPEWDISCISERFDRADTSHRIETHSCISEEFFSYIPQIFNLPSSSPLCFGLFYDILDHFCNGVFDHACGKEIYIFLQSWSVSLSCNVLLNFLWSNEGFDKQKEIFPVPELLGLRRSDLQIREAPCPYLQEPNMWS